MSKVIVSSVGVVVPNPCTWIRFKTIASGAGGAIALYDALAPEGCTYDKLVYRGSVAQPPITGLWAGGWNYVCNVGLYALTLPAQCVVEIEVHG
jgi:hypothetical protein